MVVADSNLLAARGAFFRPGTRPARTAASRSSVSLMFNEASLQLCFCRLILQVCWLGSDFEFCWHLRIPGFDFEARSQSALRWLLGG
jgi:hypothetical protein